MLRRPILRSRLRPLLKARPGVDPADPALAERVRCVFGPEGYRVDSAGYTHLVPWSGIVSLDETPDVLVLVTGPMHGYVLPRRDLSQSELRAVRALAAHHIGGG